VDPVATGFTEDSPTNAKLSVSYQGVAPISRIRPGFPDDITVEFSDVFVDTSITNFPLRALPAKFTIRAHSAGGDQRLDFRFLDLDADGTLSRVDEYFDVVTYLPEAPDAPVVTWRAVLDTLGQAERGPLEPPAGGDAFDIVLRRPLGADDVFTFDTRAGRVEDGLATEEFRGSHPYVVPNPYVGSASFEPERFAINGRGERRIEFRGLPQSCTVRIYTVRGRLVQTLEHDGSTDGYVAWNLRTKDNLDVAPGLYIFHVDGRDIGTYVGKFAVIK
jgi:hypothetical protein